MKTLTIKFNRLDGRVKATVFEDENKYLYAVEGHSEGECLEHIVPIHTVHERARNASDALSRRAD